MVKLFFDKKVSAFELMGVFFCFFSGLAIFIVSMVLMPFYTGGDQEHYRGFYDSVREFDFYSGYFAYREFLGTQEPVYYVLVYFFSKCVEKDLFVSVLNGFLGYLLVKKLIKINVAIPIIFLLSFNFYYVVILFSAERLKVAVILLMLCLNYVRLNSPLLWGGILLSHIQVIFLVWGLVLIRITGSLKALLGFRINVGALYIFVLMFFLIVILSFLLKDHVLSKFHYYSSGSTGWDRIGSVFKPVIFFFLTLLYAKDKKSEVVLLSLPVVFSAFFVGDERLVMILYFIFMCFALQKNRGINWGVLTTGLYFSVKGVLFVKDFVLHGSGFL